MLHCVNFLHGEIKVFRRVSALFPVYCHFHPDCLKALTLETPSRDKQAFTKKPINPMNCSTSIMAFL